MTVYLVGAGPGHPGLLTVRAAELLAAADVVVHDRLISEEVLDLVPVSCRRIDVGKAAGWSPITQDEINALLVEHGRSGAQVVRLKGGDPYVFGRGGEEAVALLAAQVPFEVVPGVSAALAAPAAAGIPVTMRHRALSFTVVTGHEDETGPGGVDWEGLARTGTTLVILMGASRMGTIARRLMAGGLSPTTPVTAVRWATTCQQEVVRTDLASVEKVELESPTTVVVGAVADLDLRSLPEAGQG
jgi:uroporphyrinogen III methyltransferase / synthase